MIREIRLNIDAEDEARRLAQHFSLCVTPLGDPSAANADVEMFGVVDEAAALGKSFIAENIRYESPVKG